VFRAVKSVASVLQGFAGVARGEQCVSESQAEINGVVTEAAGVGQEDASFSFGNGLGIVAQVPLEFAG